MADKFKLLIFTPYGHYFEGDVEFLEVFSDKYSLGILPGHAPLITTLIVSKMTIRINENTTYNYAIGGGVMNIDKEKVTLILDSVEREDEIDVKRAESAKKRAEDRLNELDKNAEIDRDRAKLAYARAINRIRIAIKE